MYIDSIKLRNFRNYQQASLKLQKGMNILVGENGVGKTNLLEAIYFLSTTRSHRNVDDPELIYFDEDFASIDAHAVYQNDNERLSVMLYKTGKTLLVNNTPVKRTSEFIGRVNAVLFAPSDMDLFETAPKARRRLIDMELGKLSSLYMYELSKYLKCLKERNAYLKTGTNKVMLETYTDMLYEPQIKIIANRSRFVNSLNAYMSYFYNQLAGTNSKLTVEYNSFIKEKNNESVMAEQIKAAYAASASRDMYTQMTNVGIHREDFTFYLDGRDVSLYASQGQKRMVILAAKLSIVQIIFQIKREYPILLLDDVFSELDSKRRLGLLRLLPASIQTIITTTDAKEVSMVRNQNVNVITIAKGKIVNG
jgi:DNA replication and repair protein RecF